MEILLKAKTAATARREIRQRWPELDVPYTGYATGSDFANDEAVIMSLVRGATKGNVATATKNRAPRATYFIATIPD